MSSKPIKLDKFLQDSDFDHVEVIAKGSKGYTIYRKGQKESYKVREWEDWGEMIINENMDFLRDSLRYAREQQDLDMWGKLFFATLKYFRAELRTKESDKELDKKEIPVIILPPQEDLVPPEEDNILNIENEKKDEDTNI